MAIGLNLLGVQVASAREITMSSWKPGGALVLMFPASLIEYSKASSSSITSGQTRGSGRTIRFFSKRMVRLSTEVAFSPPVTDAQALPMGEWDEAPMV